MNVNHSASFAATAEAAPLSRKPAFPAGIGSEFGFGSGGGLSMSLIAVESAAADRMIAVNSGRAAIALAARAAAAADRQDRNSFLLPSYLCHTMIQPFLDYGFPIDFYPVGADLKIRFEDIAERVRARTLGVLLMHYFGIPQDSGLARRLHETFPVLALIDDRTHLLLGDLESRFAETGPATAIYSVRKWAAFPDLGLTVWPGKPPAEYLLSGIVAQSWDRRLFRARMKGLASRTAFFRWHGSRLRQTSLDLVRSAESLYDEPTVVCGTSFISRFLWRHWRWQSAILRRRENFLHLFQNWPERAGSPLIRSLPAGACPLGFPVRVEKRDEFRQSLISSGIYPPVHWHKPPQVSEAVFPESARLSTQELTIPIDQRYSIDHMDQILEVAYAR